MKQHTSIAHFSSREQQTLLRLKNKLVVLCNPMIIYLIDSRTSSHLSRNCFSDSKRELEWTLSCDLLLVLREGEKLPESIKEELLSISRDLGKVRLIAHPIDFVEKQLKDYSLFFCWIRQRAIILHENNSFRNKLPEPVKNLKQYEKQAHDFFANNPDFQGYSEVKLSPLPEKNKVEEEKKECVEINLKLSKSLQNKIGSFLKEHGASSAKSGLEQVMSQNKKGSSQLNDSDELKQTLSNFIDLFVIFDQTEQDTINPNA